MAELDAPDGGSEIPDPTMGTPEHPAGGERGNAEPDATRAGGASGAAGGLAEPRSRQEVAAEAREGKVFHPGHGVVYMDGREVEATHNAADGVWFGGMGEIPDAPLGDPFGTGRAGEVVASTDEVKMSRLERFNRVVSERLDDIVEQADHIAETVQDLHQKDPPRPPAPIFTGTAERSPEISPSTVMEDIIRPTFSGTTSGQYDDRTRADIMLFVLGQLIFDEDLDDTGLDDFLVMARAMAARRRRG